MAKKIVQFFCVVGLLMQGDPILGIEDYCSQNTYRTNTSYMQFTKEPSMTEYAVVGKFKGLHCCAKGYRSIEWYKDGRPYPWPSMSQLILYPESVNQTVYAKSISKEDAGNYTCLLRNETVVHSHTIQLTVFDKLPDEPKLSYISAGPQVPLGQSARLFCEAFAARVDLPDALNEVLWMKTDSNSTIDDDPRVRQEKTSREFGQTFGAYLIIDYMKPEDYGEYVCEISVPGKPTMTISVNITEEKTGEQFFQPQSECWFRVSTIILPIGFCVLVAVVCYYRFALSVKVHIKDSLGKLEVDDGKTSDVLIAYCSDNSDIALGVLLPTLEHKYNYKCASRQLPDEVSAWCSDLEGPSRKCRRIVVLLPPSSVDNRLTSQTLREVIRPLQRLKSPITYVFLKAAGITRNPLAHLHISSIHGNTYVIQWNGPKDEQFWMLLRLRLPPRRKPETIALENTNKEQGDNSSRLTGDLQHTDDLV